MYYNDYKYGFDHISHWMAFVIPMSTIIALSIEHDPKCHTSQVENTPYRYIKAPYYLLKNMPCILHWR